MWWPFKKKDEAAKQELANIDKKISHHRTCFNGLCRIRQGTTERAHMHQQLFHLWQARRAEFRAKHLFGNRQ